MIHFRETPWEQYAVMLCGLDFNQIARLEHRYVADPMDAHKVSCQNCKGFLRQQAASAPQTQVSP